MCSPRIDRVLLCALVAISLFACSQGEGEPCQVKSDCDDGLICVFARGAPRSTCEAPETVGADSGAAGAAGEESPLPSEDAGELQDGGASGAGGASGDASVPVAGAPADAGPDAGDAGDLLGEDAGG